MPVNNHGKLLLPTVGLVILLTVVWLGVARAQPATPLPPGVQEDYGCVSYRTGPNFNRNRFLTCTQSTAWWESFSCPQTPIQHGPWTPNRAGPLGSSPFLYNPWLNLPSTMGDVVVILWFGSRPMPVVTTSEVGRAEISVVFPEPMRSVEVFADERDVVEGRNRAGVPNDFVGDLMVWDVNGLFPPAPGCWEYFIIATPEYGNDIRIPFTFVAVD